MGKFKHKEEELITDKNEILATTLKYNIGVLTKNKVSEKDIPEIEKRNKLHEWVINDTSKGKIPAQNIS